jgi:hypothetical protein
VKYRVVGWTDYDGFDVEESKGCIGFAERNAIIDEIRKKGYLFSGWDHQETWNCVPVLNDGKKRCYSQRGWGGVMAEAYGHMGNYDYASFTFRESINPSACVLPSFFDDRFEPEDFTPEEDLNEHFEIAVDEGIWKRAMQKNPFFLDDLDALRFIDTGDTVTLRCGEKSKTFEVTDINRAKAQNRSSYTYRINTKYKIILTYRENNK